MSALGLASFYTMPLYAKTTKDIVKYQDTPNEGKKCMNCMHFIPETNKCKTVEGDINPNGWCTIFVKKT
ncbi:high-potential iron-sulfur protein [Sulfurovum sp.]|uniref:high-potential iron-sulfur protein n=1 Tax=Sulfurovum sp. TaxID=1969726 RepID=UPI00356663A7